MKGCKNCKYNRKRTLENKTCLKEHKTLFGFSCIDYKPNYEIGYQVTIYDILEEEERSERNDN